MSGLGGFHGFGHGRQGPDMSAQVDAAKGKSLARGAQRSVEHLEERVDRLLLVCASLWELLKERTDLTEEDLVTKVREIDAADGQVDHKVTNKVEKCHKCGRTLQARQDKCLYCGAGKMYQRAFDFAR